MVRRLRITSVLHAAAMLAEGVPMPEIARQLGVTDRTILSWSKTEEAQAHIAAINASVAEATKGLAVANKVRRIVQAQEMVDGIDAVIAARRKAGASGRKRLLDPDPVPGEETGHVAVKEIEIKGVRTREAAFDAALHNERRKWLEYVAKEKGELDTRLNVKHSGRVDHVVQRRDLSGLTDEELDHLTELAQKIEAGAVDA